MKYSTLHDPRVRQSLAQIHELAAQMPPQGPGRIVKNTLSGGEISPGMGARFDQQRYLSGCHSLLNMCPMPCGGVTKRPGMRFVSWAAQTTSAYQVRLVPFVFSATDSRMLEFYEMDTAVGLRVWFPNGSSLTTTLLLPWTPGILATATFCQSADVLYYATIHRKPGKIMRYSDSDWRFAYINWMPAIAPPTLHNIRETSGGDGGAKTWFYYTATAISDSGEESAQGNIITIEANALSSVHHILFDIAPVAGAIEYRIYKRRAGVYGFIGRVLPASGLTFEDANVEPDTEDTPPSYKDPFPDQPNYPSIVFMHQQRLGFAASNARPLTLWLSQAGNFESMAAKIPPNADDAIEATMAAPEANRILWAQSDRTGLAIGTEGGEWLLASGEGAALTPQDLSFQPQTYFGSSPGLPVLRAGSSILYVQRGGCAAREFGYSFADDRYQSSDLSLLARHILKNNQIASWCWQPEPYGIVWCVLYDGRMAGLTYLREHDVIGWHRHETDGWVESCAAMPGPGGAWQVWLTVFRKLASGQQWRAIERLGDFFEGGNPANAGHADGPWSQPFAARVIPCLMEASADAGSAFGMVRKINSIKARVINSQGFQVRALGQNMEPGQPMNVPARGAAYTGQADWSCPLAAGYREGARMEFILDGPAPVTILGINCAVEMADSLGGQK